MVDLAHLDGAVTDEVGLLHVGSPLGEQRALTQGTALALLSDRSVLTVTGEDRLTWLDSLTSQALARLRPGESTEFLILDPHGHIEYAVGIVDDGATSWLLVDQQGAAGLTQWLTRMRFRLRVDVHDVSAEHVVFGGTAAATEAVTGAAVWRDPWPEVRTGGWGYASEAGHAGDDRDWSETIVPVSAADTFVASGGAGGISIVGRLAADALRIGHWRPRGATEADGRMLPHEVDWLRTAVHLSKGCYRGQETVAKIHNLGHPPRRVIGVQLDGSDTVLPEPGSIVRAGDTEVGVLTSVARHYEQGPIGLAVVKRSTPVDAELTVDGPDGAQIAAQQEVIVPPDAGREAAVPRMPRLGRR